MKYHPQYNCMTIIDIFTYPALRPEVMHNFRIFGNAIVLLNQFDLAAIQLQTTTFLQAAPFLGYTLDGIQFVRLSIIYYY